MPTTITSSSGTVYHLWQLPDLSAPEPSESIAFNTLRNDLADGYSSKVLFGSNTGLRSWSLTLPTLASSDVMSNTVTGINGEAVSREQYVWDLYCESQITGDPFVYQSPRNNQYYLVEFADESLTYERARVKLYSTGITLRQVRVSGETVFDPTLLTSVWGWWDGDTALAGSAWAGRVSGQVSVAVTGDVVDVAAAQNGHMIKRFSNTTNDGVLKNNLANPGTYDAFVVMKMREAAFSNAAGILTDRTGGDSILIGDSGTTKFANPSLSPTAFTYKLNGVEYEQSDMQAPMNTWGVVQVRYTTGFELPNGIQMGKSHATAGTFAELDLGEVILANDVLPITTAREITEYLIVKWGIV